MENKIQLNASLKFNPQGELIGRDLLVNFREESVEECCQLLADFTRRFNLNLGLVESPQLQSPQGKAVTVTYQKPEQERVPAPRCPRCLVPMQRYASKYKPNSYWLGCPNFRLTGCLEKMPA